MKETVDPLSFNSIEIHAVFLTVVLIVVVKTLILLIKTYL